MLRRKATTSSSSRWTNIIMSLLMIVVAALSLTVGTTNAFVVPLSTQLISNGNSIANQRGIVQSSYTKSTIKRRRRIGAREEGRLHANSNSNDNKGGDVNGETLTAGSSKWDNVKPQVYSQRWVQLGYLSALALLSDWICFSTAASPSTFETAFAGHTSASLIDIFLFTNVASCFMVTDVVAKFGLQRCIQGAALLMTVGCWLRSGFNFLLPIANAIGIHAATSTAADAAHSLVPYNSLLAGTIMVGAAQPFFQCTPPLLSAQWFASDERATSTAVALNFNQIGIATAFLVGGTMGTTVAGLSNYFALIACVCTAVFAGTMLQFQNKPPIPPSTSELEKVKSGESEPPFIESIKTYFSTPGFTRPLAAFICSITITNIVGAFIDEVMERGGITNQFQVDLAGAGFELAILLGGIVIGGYVDKTKEYKKVTLACLAVTAFMLIPLGLTDHAIGKEPVLLVLSLLGLGMAAGPVQPINAELAVDVTFPGDETAVESVQQIGGNLISALLVPVAEAAANVDPEIFSSNKILDSDIRGDVILLVVIAAVTFTYFAGFDAPLKRSIADCSSESDPGADSCSTIIDTDVVKETVVSK